MWKHCKLWWSPALFSIPIFNFNPPPPPSGDFEDPLSPHLLKWGIETVQKLYSWNYLMSRIRFTLTTDYSVFTTSLLLYPDFNGQCNTTLLSGRKPLWTFQQSNVLGPIYTKIFTYHCEQLVHMTLGCLRLYNCICTNALYVSVQVAKSNKNNRLYVCVWWMCLISSCRSNKRVK